MLGTDDSSRLSSVGVARALAIFALLSPGFVACGSPEPSPIPPTGGDSAATGAGGSGNSSAATGVQASSGGASNASTTNATSANASASTTGAGGADGCPAGATRCPDQCWNLMTSYLNCGACGNACEDGSACVNGSCGCGAGEQDCGSGCVSVQADPQNCGSCGNACPSGQVCSQGSCSASGCASHLTECGGACVDANGDNRHCGGCDNACPAGLQCRDGECGCGSTQLLCDGVCVDGQSNNQHCGACNQTCSGSENCVDGFCLDPADLNCGGGAPFDNGCSANHRIGSNKYYLVNNLWGANGVQGEQCLWRTCLAGDLVGWGTSWSWPRTSGVKSYTSVVLGWHWGWDVSRAETGMGVQVSSGASIQCGWDFTVTGSSDMAVAYDLWTHTTPEPGNVDPSDEIMIWLYHEGAVGPIGTLQATTTIAGVGWDLYRGEGGATWEVYSFLRQQPTTTQVFDVMDFTEDLVNRGWLQSSKYLVSIEAGPEVSGGDGEVVTNGFYCR